jgi:hypothetical protein
MELSVVPDAHHALTNRRESGPFSGARAGDNSAVILPPDAVEYVNHDWLQANGYAIRFPTGSVRNQPPRRQSGGVSSRRRSSMGVEPSQRRSSDSSASGVVTMEQLEMPHSILLGADDSIKVGASKNPMHHAIVNK